jgi:AAA family ATP:ADP antiporter
MTKEGEFTGWRAFFWPIYRSEWKKFFPMVTILFLIVFNYNFLRTFKDSLLVTAPHSGAEAIPFIKVWAILPGALFLTYLFTRLANRYTREQVFYIMMSIFLVFFFLFTFVLYPFREALHPHDFADKLQAILPSGFKGLIAIFRNWIFTLFYMMSELWSTAIMSVLFWGFMNDVTKIHEAKRYYSLLMVGANISSIVAGQAAIWLSTFAFNAFIPYGSNKWEQSILILNCTVIGCGLIIIGLFRWVNRNVIRPEERKIAHKPEKVKMSMRANFSYLAKSKYLLCIAALVLTYNISMNLVEVVWKNQIHSVYPDPSDFRAYMGKVTTAIGIVATFCSLFLTSNVIRRFSWTTAAMVPALVMLVTGLGFFLFVMFQDSWLGSLSLLAGVSPLVFGLFLGSFQNTCGHACKYTFFDATKEIAFIPLDSESKLKGKAAIDGVGSRLGKSGGSVIHQGFLLLFTTVASSTPYVAAIFVAVLLIWIFSALSLGKQFDALTGKKPIPAEESLPEET